MITPDRSGFLCMSGACDLFRRIDCNSAYYNYYRPKRHSLQSLMAEWRAWRHPALREFVTLTARKAA